ncbi:hypothetical protein T4A_12701 [Trichinella pseudospiralis]|uniref:Uncharacterized protein n=1 Tax=Trichinella pseudospiralis TaxID=6337 RepID=A0A0V1E8J5_TRIPS|nr:hypothetical protein T4A_12701 [Trichinella pseudospiralis]
MELLKNLANLILDFVLPLSPAGDQKAVIIFYHKRLTILMSCAHMMV